MVVVGKATIASTVVTGVAVAVMDQAVRRTPALSVRSHCPFIGRLVKKTLAEKASGSSKKRKVEPPDEPPAPEPDEATVEIGRNEMAALMHATRLFAVTMAATMSNFLEGQLK